MRAPLPVPALPAPPPLALGRVTRGAIPASAAALSPGRHRRPCRSPRSPSPPGPWKRAPVMLWAPPACPRSHLWCGGEAGPGSWMPRTQVCWGQGWEQAAGLGPCSPVLPKVQGEGVPSGPQDVAHTLRIQALSREKREGSRERGPAPATPTSNLGVGSTWPVGGGGASGRTGGSGQVGSSTQNHRLRCLRPRFPHKSTQGKGECPLPGSKGRGDTAPDRQP